MKPALIRTRGEMPPGGFPFSDRITGKQYRDLSAGFDQRCAQIQNDRMANKRLITSQKLLQLDHIAQELSEYVCEQLRANDRYCTNGGSSVSSQFPRTVDYQTKPCPHCGEVKLTQIICSPCGGKVTGYRCHACGKESPK